MIDEAKIQCDRCGVWVDRVHRYCPACGHRLDPSAPNRSFLYLFLFVSVPAAVVGFCNLRDVPSSPHDEFAGLPEFLVAVCFSISFLMMLPMVWDWIKRRRR